LEEKASYSTVIPSFAFVGKMASGKNTYADALKAQLEKEFGITVYRPAFSDPIKEIAVKYHGMVGKDRALLQAIGAKHKEIDPGVWAKYLARDAVSSGRLPIVVDGMRSPDEAAAFRTMLPKVWIVRIDADEKQRLEFYKKAYGRYPTKEERNDITEKTVEKVKEDVRLVNDYTSETLRRHLEELTGIARREVYIEEVKRRVLS
jgi:hypothetical protein